MSTQYINNLFIIGNPKEIQSFAQKCKGWDRYSPSDEDDYARAIRDFMEKNTHERRKIYIKTMSSSEATKKARAETKEEIAEKFRPRTEEEIQNAIEINRQKHFSEEPYFSLNALHPEPETNTIKDSLIWRLENWGCRYARASDFEVSDDHIKISLVVISGRIGSWVLKVSKDFPTLWFNLEWMFNFEWNEGYSPSEGGCYLIQNGEVLQGHDSERSEED